MGDYVWTDSTIRQFRYYPFGSTPAEDGAECCIEYMAFFKTESEAESYKGPNAVADTTEADPTASAETADMSAVVVLAASASLDLALAPQKEALTSHNAFLKQRPDRARADGVLFSFLLI